MNWTKILTLRDRRQWALMAFVLMACLLMALVDGLWKLDYWPKAGLKLLLFLLLPLCYSRFFGKLELKGLFTVKREELLPALGLGAGVYVLIVGGYFLLRGVFDFSRVTGALTADIGVDGGNFLWVALYISFVNSLLEEFFFRGFAFLGLRKLGAGKLAWGFSALCFALYHVAMMGGWFSPLLLGLLILGLFIGGLLFNALNVRSGSIYGSWLFHMFANFGINTVGFVLFGGL